MDRVIELDASWDLLEEPPQRSRAGWVQHRRLLALAVVVVLSLATLGAARPLPAPAFTLVGILPSAARGPNEMFLAGDAVITQTEGQTIAYEPTGEVRWKRPGAIDEGGYTGFRMWQGHLLEQRTTFALEDVDGTPRMPQIETAALDPATGEKLWEIDGYLMPVGELIASADGNGPMRVYRSLPDGLLWTVPQARAGGVDRLGSAVFTVTSDGVLTEYDLATGSVRRTAKVELPRAANSTRNVDTLDLQPMPDRIILRAQYFTDLGPRSSSQAYDRATLRPVVEAGNRFEAIWDCGPVLCAALGESISILDTATRKELWRAPDKSYPFWTGSMMLVGGGSNESNAALVDPLTGAVLLALKGWSVADPGQDAILVTKFAPPDRTFVATAQPSGLRVLGIVPFQINHCQAGPGLIACAISDGRTAVWRVNR